MSFYEYLLAIGNEVMAEEMCKSPSQVQPSIQELILKELKNYFLIGGMPEVVSRWVESKSLVECFKVQNEVLTSYKDDFSKYTPKVDITCLDAVFNSLSLQSGKQVKYSTLSNKYSGKTNRKALELLCKAKIIHKIHTASPSGIPLGASINQKKFKTIFLDIGLMQRQAGLHPSANILQEDLLSMYRGQLAEQFAAQELYASSDQLKNDLYYWVREEKIAFYPLYSIATFNV